MKIFVVGGGFAGIEAAKTLSKKLTAFDEIYLIDKSEFTTLLPNLPEITSGRFKKKDITKDIVKLIPPSVTFINEEITKINLNEKLIKTKNKDYYYDYMILTTGSTTNFYGFNQNMDKVNVLDSLQAAEDIRKKFSEYLDQTAAPALVVSGAGFTGIELSCNLYELSKKKGKKLRVVFVELSKTVLPMLPAKSAEYVMKRLKKLGFEIFTDNRITAFDGENITLKDNNIIENVFFCWCSGVKSSLKPIGEYESLPDGRIKVNEFLQIPDYPEVYAAGDAAAMKDKKGNFFRRAVTFAQMAGKHAAVNLASMVKKAKQKPFKPIDLGWIIPMYITSIGTVFGMEVRGRKGIFMHYVICGIKNYSFRNFLKELLAAFRYPFARP